MKKTVTSRLAILSIALLTAGFPEAGNCGIFDFLRAGKGTTPPPPGTPPLTPDKAVTDLEAYWSGLYDSVVLPSPAPKLSSELLAKAPIDECFDGNYPRNDPGNWQGSTNPPLNPDGTCNVGQPKANESYVWGLARLGNQFWLGAAANVPCLATGGANAFDDGTLTPRVSGSSSGNPSVCEFGWSHIVTSGMHPNVPDHYGDWRRPNVYLHDASTGVTEVLTGLITNEADLARLDDTLGFRSAGAHNNVAFVAGPTIAGEDGGDGVNVFAFKADTKEFLGSTTLKGFNDIRMWLVAKGGLYTTVRTTNGKGAVLRWTGTIANPLQFTVVGNLDNMGGFLTEHEGRIFVSTWPSLGTSSGGGLSAPAVAGIYMSPAIPAGGLTSGSIWKKVWSVDKYEPDLAVQYVTLVGDLASYNGYLYWGTMQMPRHGQAAALFLHRLGRINLDIDKDGTLNSTEEDAAGIGSHRPTSIFRSKGVTPLMFGANTELLYGLQYMPVYDGYAKTYTAKNDAAHLNKMGKAPKFGKAGFNVVSNVYTWTMGAVGSSLYIGTFDAENGGSPVTQSGNILGADIYRFDNTTSPATVETLDGFGQPVNFGIRTMIPIQATDPLGPSIFLGTGTNANLSPDGGWEFIKLY
jgi:hypothetical protein